MKFFAIACLVLMSATASATLAVRSCTAQDWTLITQALSTPAESGEEYRGQILSMLAEEMGPTCALMPETARPGVPGDRTFTYALTSGARAFTLHLLVGGVENPGIKLTIVPGRAR